MASPPGFPRITLHSTAAGFQKPAKDGLHVRPECQLQHGQPAASDAAQHVPAVSALAGRGGRDGSRRRQMGRSVAGEAAGQVSLHGTVRKMETCGGETKYMLTSCFSSEVLRRC